MTNEKQAICDICGEVETNNAEALKGEGWFLGSREEFCPNCNN
jgi:RNA polymerase subunit RPABC4/transcription elongation factor Spt4